MKNLFNNYLQKVSNRPPFPLVIQSDESECGLAALCMILNAHKIPVDLETLKSHYGSTRGGITVGELCTFSAQLGLRAIPTKSLGCSLENGPVIIFVRGEHFSVLWQIEESNYCVADPSDGNLIFTSVGEFNEYYSGVSISFRRIKSHDNNLLADFQPKSTPTIASLIRWKSLAIKFIALLAIVSAFLTLANAAAQDIFMTYVVEENEISWTQGLIVISILISLLLSAVSLLMQVTLQKQLQAAILLWNNKLFASLFQAPYTFFVNKTSGLIAARFAQIDQAVEGFQGAVLSVFLGLLNLFVFVVAVLLVSPSLAFISAVAIAGFLFVGAKFYGLNIQNNYLVRQAECGLASAEFKLISGREQIVLEKSDIAISRELSDRYVELTGASTNVGIVGIYNEFFLSCVDQLLNASLLVVSSILIVQGHLTTGVYAAISVIVQTAMAPVRSLSMILETIQNSRLSFQAASDLYQDTPENASVSNLDQNKQNETSSLIEFKNVYFKYSLFSKPILENTSFSIKSRSGKSLAIRLDGDTGAGKSTFLNLILGMIKPSAGQILVRGHHITALSQVNKNSLIQYIDREPIIISGSIYKNLSLGSSPSKDDLERVIGALGLTHQSIFSSQLNRHIQDIKSISTGQAVMISLVRAALLKPELLLIDESLVSIPESLHQNIIDGMLGIGINLLIVQHGTSKVIQKLPCLPLHSIKVKKTDFEDQK